MQIKEILENYYPEQFEPGLVDEIGDVAQLKHFQPQDILIDMGETVTVMPILLDGAIKIMRDDYGEGELLLYFLEKGDTCAMTMACCLGDKQSNIRAIGETEGRVLMIPVQKMEDWLAKYPSWRKYVFDSYNNRMDEMLEAIDNLAFNDMSGRLKNYLLNVATINKGNAVHKTHLEIANELNSSRVVISRLLKSLEKEGFLVLNRNVITIQ
ncbi:Crp/Fnr family transcriptional regulator [Sphingobacterium faecale]|uniref:Crp/Fnr family transcriptional regulator n=1 Tax=Sphingobacterium faecale TaxID=2803775 RepID=A0ABS1R305_9SPHI|nr:Crp/Fnr family transcriptional regulator [Sphingobacterium faecale]MBL1408929.1 Crp/Fnr family transcriptional regulator [Sphingobacterium faecale]